MKGVESGGVQKLKDTFALPCCLGAIAITQRLLVVINYLSKTKKDSEGLGRTIWSEGKIFVSNL